MFIAQQPHPLESPGVLRYLMAIALPVASQREKQKREKIVGGSKDGLVSLILSWSFSK